MSILFETNKFHHGEPPCRGGPGAIAAVALSLIPALAVTMKFYLMNFITMVSEVFLKNYSQIFCTIECSSLRWGHLNPHSILFSYYFTY